MNVAVIASEAVPLAKTGGLADVAGALPRALADLGQDVSLFLPGYRRAKSAGVELRDLGLSISFPIGDRTYDGRILAGKLPGSDVDVFLVDQPEFYDRDHLYQENGVDYADNCQRYVFFDRAVLEALRRMGRPVDILHCNDWQTGMIPVYLEEMYRRDPVLGGAGTLFTIHNIAYQGSFWHWDMPLTGLDWKLFNWRQLEFHGRLNFLKGGLVFSDLLSTVSPTYAREIQTPEYGYGFDGLLKARRRDLFGIVNGIDPTIWNPAVDPTLAASYDAGTVSQGKPACKAQLQRRASLPERPDVPLFAQIGRLDPQKGWDLLAESADELLQNDVQFIVLGVGHPRYHAMLEQLAMRYPGKLRVFLEFSNTLAHQIEAGADIFLMPSIYEPCGLNQLYSLAYGTVPIVRSTGGLADTVVDATPENLQAGTANGIAFQHTDGNALRWAIRRALELWSDKPTWSSLVHAGMTADWSWDRVAGEYVDLYRKICVMRGSFSCGGKG